MEHGIIRYINPRSAWISARNLWCPNYSRRPSDGSLGLGSRLCDGVHHCNFRYVCIIAAASMIRAKDCSLRVGLGISYCRRNVLCHQTCCAGETRSYLGLGHWLVQLHGTGGRSGITRVHYRTDDPRGSQYEYWLLGWQLCVQTVSSTCILFEP